MVNDQQLKKLIEKAPFLAYDEKGSLISKLSQLDEEKKKKLAEFLIIETSKFVTLNLKYAATFQTVYFKWQSVFNQISKVIS
jgi:hypothetical protein